MSKFHFQHLLQRYQQGHCTEREKRLVEDWFRLLDSEVPDYSAGEQHQIEDRMWRAIQQKQATTEGKVRSLPAQAYWGWAAVAAVLLAVFVWVYQARIGQPLNSGNRSPSTFATADSLLNTRTNNSQRLMVFRLSDGTEVNLAPQSKLNYPASFPDTKRTVFLKGNAFFRVTHNPKKPFLVYTGDVVTKVLGTSFWVKTSENNQAVEVSVVTGKVSVFQRDAQNDYISGKVKSGVILTPNQRVTYTEQSRAFVPSLVERPVLVVEEDKSVPAVASFVFDDTPFRTVIDQLERAYGIEIIIENEQLNGCLFTADLARQPLFTKLDLLCASLNASYEVRGTKILISGNGCTSRTP